MSTLCFYLGEASPMVMPLSVSPPCFGASRFGSAILVHKMRSRIIWVWKNELLRLVFIGKFWFPRNPSRLGMRGIDLGRPYGRPRDVFALKIPCLTVGDPTWGFWGSSRASACSKKTRFCLSGTCAQPEDACSSPIVFFCSPLICLHLLCSRWNLNLPVLPFLVS